MKITTAIFALFCTGAIFSQNTFPTAAGTNVGIGTTSPTSRLEITSGTTGITGLKFTNCNYNTGLVSQPVGLVNPIDKVLSVDTSGKVYLAAGGSIFTKSGILSSNRQMALNGFNFEIISNNPDGAVPVDSPPGPASTSLFFINNTGNVGIGTTNFVDGSNTYRLSVKGKIRAEELKIYTTWADYVFAKDYRLPTLAEVEKQIKEKGHLANMPSAEEVKANGIEVGNMAKIQQEKIEELTLYIIELNKKLEALEAKINNK